MEVADSVSPCLDISEAKHVFSTGVHTQTHTCTHTYAVKRHPHKQMQTEVSTFTSIRKNIAKTSFSTLADQDQKPPVEYTHPQRQKGSVPELVLSTQCILELALVFSFLQLLTSRHMVPLGSGSCTSGWHWQPLLLLKG